MLHESTRRIMYESNQIGLEFVLLNMAAAQTMLDVADTTSSEETRTRTRRYALLAYEVALHFLPRLSPSEKEKPELEARLNELKRRLVSLGYLLNPAFEQESSPGTGI